MDSLVSWYSLENMTYSPGGDFVMSGNVAAITTP